MTLLEFNTYLAADLERLHAQARARTRSQDAAFDAVQNTVLRLLDQGRYLAIDCANPHAFVSAALRNIIIDGWRRPRLPGSEAEPDEVAEQSTSDPGDSADLAECERVVREALAKLSAQERQALTLYVTEVERAEASEQMDGYDQALNRARAKMNAHLGNRRAVVLRLGLERLRLLLSEQPSPASTHS